MPKGASFAGILPGAIARDDDQIGSLDDDLLIVDVALIGSDNGLFADLGPVVPIDPGITVEPGDRVDPATARTNSVL